MPKKYHPDEEMLAQILTEEIEQERLEPPEADETLQVPPDFIEYLIQELEKE
jgi:hypothetical protein